MKRAPSSFACVLSTVAVVTCGGGVFDFVAGPSAHAEDGAVPQAPPAPKVPAPRRRKDAAAIPASPVVLVGSARRLSTGVGGVNVVKVDVEKVLRGKDFVTSTSVTLFVGGTTDGGGPALYGEYDFYTVSGAKAGSHDRGKDGAKDDTASTSYFTSQTGRYALFLSPSRNGSGFALDATFSVDGAEGAEKAAVLAREVVVEAEADPIERDRRRVALALDLLQAETSWSRLHGAKRIATMAACAPKSITEETRAEIEAVSRRPQEAAVKALLARVLAATENGSAPAPGANDDATASGLSPEYHRARRRLEEATDDKSRIEAMSELAHVGGAKSARDLLVAARAAADGPVRERALVLLGDVGAREALAPAITLASGSKDSAVREALVRAVGMLGDDGDVPWLVAHAGETCLLRAVAFALARVRTPSALAALADVGRQARLSSPPDDALGKLVDYLETPAFAETERTSGRAVGPRPRLTRMPDDGLVGGGPR